MELDVSPRSVSTQRCFGRPFGRLPGLQHRCPCCKQCDCQRAGRGRTTEGGSSEACRQSQRYRTVLGCLHCACVLSAMYLPSVKHLHLHQLKWRSTFWWLGNTLRHTRLSALNQATQSSVLGSLVPSNWNVVGSLTLVVVFGPLNVELEAEPR